MDTNKILHDMRAERDKLVHAITAFEFYVAGKGGRRGRPPKWMENVNGARRRGRPPGSKNKPKEAHV